jgi:hypothetical protein
MLRHGGLDNVEQGDAVFFAWANSFGSMWCCMLGFAINQLRQLNWSEITVGAWSEEDRSRIAMFAIIPPWCFVGWSFLIPALRAWWWDPRRQRLLREREEREREERQRRQSRPSGMTAQADLVVVCRTHVRYCRRPNRPQGRRSIRVAVMSSWSGDLMSVVEPIWIDW